MIWKNANGERTRAASPKNRIKTPSTAIPPPGASANEAPPIRRYGRGSPTAKQTGPSPAQLPQPVLPTEPLERAVTEEPQRRIRRQRAHTGREPQPLLLEGADEIVGVGGGHAEQELVVLASAEGLVEGGALGRRDLVEAEPDTRGVGQAVQVEAKAVRDVDHGVRTVQSGHLALTEPGQRTPVGGAGPGSAPQGAQP